MASTTPPPALALLCADTNSAADAALVEALPDLEATFQSAVIENLIRRGHEASLRKMVARFRAYSPELKQRVCQFSASLTPSIRAAFESDGVEPISGASELIQLSGRSDLAFVLADVLRQKTGRVQEDAAAALHGLTAGYLALAFERGEATVPFDIDRHRGHIVEALRDGIEHWDRHFQPKLLEAAGWMFDELGSLLAAKVQDPSAKVAPMLNGLIRGTSDPRMAKLVLWSLGNPTLQAAAIDALGKAGNERWINAIVDLGGEALVQQLGTLVASTARRDRARILAAVRALRLTKSLGQVVRASAQDADATVRSLAVAMLAELPGPLSEGILRTAANDGDLRVQANAIEAADILNVPDRVTYTKPKLESPNSRLRANAIKSLLRTDLRQAGAALLGMLEDESGARRLSALWVVQRLELRSVLRRVASLSQSDPDGRVRERAKRLMRDLEGSDFMKGLAPGKSQPSTSRPPVAVAKS